MINGNKIYIIKELYSKNNKWYDTFKDTWLGTCYNLRTAKSFASEYFTKYYNKDIDAIKCKYLNTIFTIKR